MRFVDKLGVFVLGISLFGIGYLFRAVQFYNVNATTNKKCDTTYVYKEVSLPKMIKIKMKDGSIVYGQFERDSSKMIKIESFICM